MQSFGEYLRTQREARKMTLAQVQRQIRVSVKYLRAFEDDDLAAYPEETYTRGFLTAYARALGLDEDNVLKKYHYFLKQFQEDQRRQRRRRIRNIGKRVALLSVPALVLGFLFVTMLWSERSHHADPLPAVTSQPTPNQVTEEKTLRIIALRETWVRLRMDDVREYAALLGAGEERTWKAAKRMEITADNPDAIRVQFDGEQYRLREAAPGGAGVWRWPNDTREEGESS